jgi:hypothetical protein
LFKEGGKKITKVVNELILKMWKEETIPHKWKYGIIGPVQKKGDTMMCDIYRAITLLCATYKILANISYVILVPYAEEIVGKYQGGFEGENQLLIKFFL